MVWLGWRREIRSPLGVDWFEMLWFPRGSLSVPPPVIILGFETHQRLGGRILVPILRTFEVVFLDENKLERNEKKPSVKVPRPSFLSRA